MSSLFQNYARRPIHLVKGQGTTVTDDKGKDYLDFTSGIAVVSLGHAHPAIVEAVQKQSEQLWHVSNLFESPEQEQLATTLVQDTPFNHAFFCNSGAEANEAAIKLARKHTQKNVIITFETIIPWPDIRNDVCNGSREDSPRIRSAFGIVPHHSIQ